MTLPSDWASNVWSKRILGKDPDFKEHSRGDWQLWAAESLDRLRAVRDELRKSFIGMGPDDEGARHIPGYLTDWLLAGVVARENVLVAGPPGTAKTQMVLLLYRLLGLQEPPMDKEYSRLMDGEVNSYEAWQERCRQEAEHQKYFHYLLSKYTQPDELFGPVSLQHLKRGVLVRVNFSFATGPGVRGIFCDEIFKASSSILNVLLTLMQERTYFNWGRNMPADAVMFIGATNEVPGATGSAEGGVAERGEDFSFLYAFMDRFSVRLRVPSLSARHVGSQVMDSEMGKAFTLALRRERSRFLHGDDFEDQMVEYESQGKPKACVNDLLLAGRALFDEEIGAIGPEFCTQLKERLMILAEHLQPEGTDLAENRVRWTISPRKLRSLYKVALAHAWICGELDTDALSRALGVFQLIWDAPDAEVELIERVEGVIPRL